MMDSLEAQMDAVNQAINEEFDEIEQRREHQRGIIFIMKASVSNKSSWKICEKN